MYKHSFSCKRNCTEVEYTATKLHQSSDKTDRAWTYSLLQNRALTLTPSPNPDSGGLRLHTPVFSTFYFVYHALVDEDELTFHEQHHYYESSPYSV